jgi:hypothetical protein
MARTRTTDSQGRKIIGHGEFTGVPIYGDRPKPPGWNRASKMASRAGQLGDKANTLGTYSALRAAARAHHAAAKAAERARYPEQIRAGSNHSADGHRIEAKEFEAKAAAIGPSRVRGGASSGGSSGS